MALLRNTSIRHFQPLTRLPLFQARRQVSATEFQSPEGVCPSETRDF